MALTIFLKLCTMLDIDKVRKVTKPDYPKKFRIIQNGPIRAEKGPK